MAARVQKRTMNGLVSEALQLSSNSPTPPAPNTNCCRCHATGSCSNCSCKKTGRACVKCLPHSSSGNCLNRTNIELPAVSNDEDTRALPQSSPVVQCSSCCELRGELTRLTKLVEELLVSVQRLTNSPSLDPVAEKTTAPIKRRFRPDRRRKEKLVVKDGPNQPLSSTKRNMVPLLGKRKIWGTRRLSSASTISETIARCTSLNVNDIQVKRKFSERYGKETKWWFVVSGEESTLTSLENEWESVKQQQNWKILPCLAFAENSLIVSHSTVQPVPVQIPSSPNPATTHSADSPGSGDGRHIISDVSPSVEANSTAINSGSSNNPLTSQSVPSSLPANVPMSLSPNCSSTGDNLPST